MRHSLALVRAGDPLFFFSPPHGPSLHNDVGNSRSPSGVQLRSRGEAPPVYFLFFLSPFLSRGDGRIHSTTSTLVPTPTHTPLRETDHSRPPSR